MTQTTPPSRTPEDRRIAVWRMFLHAHAAVIERIERDLAAAGRLPLSAYDVLVALAEAPDRRLRMHELAQAIVLNRSTLSRRVDRLEHEGLLTRERGGADKRGAYAVLTERGREALRAAWPIYARGINDYFIHHLSETEIGVLTEALARIYDAAQRNDC
jgi:DNA-binding MarR family transcriptional regulator